MPGVGDRLGSAARDHDLSGLGSAPLRSHGGRAEQSVPFLLSTPVSAAYRDRAQTTGLKNFDLFDYALNGVAGSLGLGRQQTRRTRLVSRKSSL